MIPFNVPPCVGDELEYVKQAIDAHKICGDGAFTKMCNNWMEERFHTQKVLLTTSGTTALDMAMLLCGLQPGDEVILPSFTFSSTATAAVLAGARLVFVDVRPAPHEHIERRACACLFHEAQGLFRGNEIKIHSVTCL